MIALSAFAGARVGVLGLGRSGLAVARALKAGDAEVMAWDDGAAARAAAESAGLALGELARPREAESLDLLVVSPGIAHLHPEPHPAVAAAWAAGVPVDNDVGLCFRALAGLETPPRVVAVTGSNGKSTTAALIHHLLLAEGRPAQLGGNIGRAVFDLDPPQEDETLVLELSSYQIELARSLAPDISVFLNLSPDHLDRHGGIGGYFAAKRRLFELGAPERMVVGVDDDYGRFLANSLADRTEAAAPGNAPVIAVSAARKLATAPWSVFMAKAHLAEWRVGRQMAAIDLREAAGLVGQHNHQNACAAYAAVRALGLGPRQIGPGLLSFKGLAHRLERIAEIDGVLFVNDSKATNADAAEKALLAYDRIRWIAGGRAKEGGIASLAPQFGRIAHAYLIGEAANAFASTLGQTPHTLCGDLDTAFARALADAAPGDVVLLAPAAASFDQFSSFEARGEAFRALVSAASADRAGGTNREGSDR